MKIIIVIDRLSAFREIVRSRVLPELVGNGDTEVVLVTSPAYRLEDGDLPDSSRLRHRTVSLEPQSRMGYTLDKLHHTISRDLLCTSHPESSLAQIRRSLLEHRGRDPHRRMGYASQLQSWGLRSRHLAHLAECWGSYPDLDAVWEEEKPDLIVYSNMMMGQMDCLRSARRRGIPLLLDIPTWDQPSSKGPMTIRPDHVIAWSEEMKAELIRYHDIAEDAIHLPGILYFDSYFDPPEIPNREDFCRERGLDPAKKIITYSLSRVESAPCALKFIDLLVDLVNRGALGHPCQLVVRASPLDNVNLIQDLATRPGIHLQFPSGQVNAEGNDWRPAPHEDRDRIAAITHSDVMLMIQSTMILDSALVDRPIVNLAYDAGLEVEGWKSVKRIFHYNHAQSYQEIGATWMVRSHEDLKAALRTYLDQPELHRAERRQLIDSITPYQDGKTYKRWARTVADIARTGRSGS